MEKGPEGNPALLVFGKRVSWVLSREGRRGLPPRPEKTVPQTTKGLSARRKLGTVRAGPNGSSPTLLQPQPSEPYVGVETTSVTRLIREGETRSQRERYFTVVSRFTDD